MTPGLPRDWNERAVFFQPPTPLHVKLFHQFIGAAAMGMIIWLIGGVW